MARSNEDSSEQASLFRNLRFWIAQRVPQRSHFLELVKNYGGEIAPLEQNASILIADHLRRDAPAGSYSYTWIEASIKNSRLEDKEPHRAGPTEGYSRPVASQRPAKTGSRNPYTAEDDRALYEWVKGEEEQGGLAKGNEIYKQLEKIVSTCNGHV